MNKKELVEEISVKTGLTKEKAKITIDAILETIKEELADGEKVQIVGFGAFQSKRMGGRIVTNPQNLSEKISVPARNKVSFKPSKSFRDFINN